MTKEKKIFKEIQKCFVKGEAPGKHKGMPEMRLSCPYSRAELAQETTPAVRCQPEITVHRTF